MSLEENIKKAAIRLGYESCGIISADDFQAFDEGVEKHKANFPHASQLYDSIKYMGSPKTYFPWGKSIIVCLEECNKYHIPSKSEDFIHNCHLVGCRLDYPKSDEVKDNFQDYLKQAGLRGEEVKVPKRWAAVKAGLGKFRNNNFIYGNYGSWVTIDTWMIDRKLAFEPVSIKARSNCPPDCNCCIKACPTGALSAPMEMDVTKCKAYITYKVMMAAGIKMNYGQCICDICQSVCPVNQKNETESFKKALLLERLFYLDDIFSMEKADFFQLLQPYYGKLYDDSFGMWKSNILKAMASMHSAEYDKYFQMAHNDRDEIVQKTAQCIRP